MEGSSLNKIPILLVLLLATLTLGQGCRVGFYDTTCPSVESIVQSALRSNPTTAAGILRMFFHDCFVHGCDGSILINGTSTERTNIANVPLVGFDVIDAAKSQLETICPGVVSCADILALAARDAVVLTGGTSWEVPLGRRDGLVSRRADADNLPAFNDSITVQIRKFEEKGLNSQDLVTLVGGHTIGRAACITFRYRLYNFNNTNRPDPDINPAFLPQLRAQCPEGGNAATRVILDTGSGNNFDTSYFANLRNGRGVLESDAKLWSDTRTQRFVKKYLGVRGLFSSDFARAMVKLGFTELKTGSEGEIRRVCSAIN